MANYYSKGRSNAFRVKDLGAFAAAAEPFGTVYPEADDRVIVLTDNEAGDFSHYNEGTGTETTLADILPDHFRDG